MTSHAVVIERADDGGSGAWCAELPGVVAVADVALSCPEGHLEFTVTDDGGGLDAAKPAAGTGLQGMAGRLPTVGGTLYIRSAPGLGTTISGSLPAGEPAEASHRPDSLAPVTGDPQE